MNGTPALTAQIAGGRTVGNPAGAAQAESAAGPRLNEDVDWDLFDSAAYFAHNYSTLRPDDGEIIRIVADFFEQQKQQWPDTWRPKAIDVGAGANLYPALTMLPFTGEITLYERASSNRAWLTEQMEQEDGPSPTWKQFWAEMIRGRSAYQTINDPLNLLTRRARVVKGSVYGLQPEQYDIGTMFFVAESITTRDDEFERATRMFVNSLRAHAPFAAAFMKNSSGYRVGENTFPACSVDENDILRALSGVARDVTINPVESNDLRDGYGGMIVVTGRKKM
ncbi:SCO2525 family SAM-dependent methyltransferase [Winogradskya consettensis]|uniref:SCO2525 family SAM-dependent methyltransferase n=1 Tax=Winogradskya consettensis TaxID=113560 RepID=UPI001BB39F10|nr:SCO2525 family SAM-dependent methyltransferase [Actinoplanes consettensis]